MDELAWFDFSLFLLLLGLFVIVFVKVTISSLHKVYFMFHFFMMLWPLSQAMVDLSHNATTQLTYVLFSFVALSLLGGGWLLLTIYLSGRARYIKEKDLIAIFIPALLSAIIVSANPFHLFVKASNNNYVHRTYGPLFWLIILILLCYFTFSIYFIIRGLISRKTTIFAKKQLKLTLWGIIVLTCFSLADLFINVILKKWFPIPIIPGLTSAGIFLSDLFFVVAVVRYKVFDIVLIAHQDIFNTIPYGMLVLDENETIIEMNKALHHYFDFNLEETFDIASFLETVQVEGDKQAFLDAYHLKSGGSAKLHIILDQPSATHFILEASPILYKTNNPIGQTITFQDVTRLRELVSEMDQKNKLLQERNLSLESTRDQLAQVNLQLEEMANTDSLTNCYNRRYMTELLSQELVHYTPKQPFALILFDIDYFKRINDQYGHLMGDEVLCRTVQTVKHIIRPNDVLSRYGGEEFLLYLPQTDLEEAKVLAETIRLAVHQNIMFFQPNLEMISVSISIGLLHVDEAYMTSSVYDGELVSLFETVDQALYLAKHNGRNRVEYSVRNHLYDNSILN
ncbi:diguanylate cyclase [Pullulanibacillus sp. KACC 23026]|uniref:histidine kinase N-terminal 7TM domain-containing diguanylate cyclase n=1 Tax=Pullulanibacillus sp. KACC 23026 TaxID=3028315 RepID=UPI0023B08F88|nr:diguanylate cyclase [Pullulanibacillus sp. KACC 23026]WEG12350.1 diguanylate cyclase [Pullulanibacillus sp. KACC 23026]